MNPINDQSQWDQVMKYLESEHLKLASYDEVLIPLLGNLKSKKVLDYGSGPGVLALGLSKLGAEIHAYDINPEMRSKTADKIGHDRVYDSVEKIPHKAFDAVIINLVLCIVSEQEVLRIMQTVKKTLKPGGVVWVGFCNPLIFKAEETQLDFRFATGEAYEKNHDYRKIKKEGGYEIIESHRPIEWYDQKYKEAGFEHSEKLFTPEYEFKGQKIKDFVIFKLS